MIIIFDVDGVLIDVTKSYHYSIKDTVSYFTGKEVPKEELLDIKFSFNINNDWDASVAGIIYAMSGLDLRRFKQMFEPYSNSLGGMYEFALGKGINLPQYNKLIEIFEDFYHRYREREEMIFSHDILERLTERLT
ncbi:MAG: hypothetical protein Q9M89_01790 [Persephonella sp.]|nr:hypothetical protein [Persephonella sp.]